MYGTDLADLYRNEMSLRQLWVRIKSLPPPSPLQSPLPLHVALEKAAKETDSPADAAQEALERFGRG